MRKSPANELFLVTECGLILEAQGRRQLRRTLENSEKRDAVALRISALGESAHKIGTATEKALSSIPVKSIRGMRNRIARDYGAVDFKIVWMDTQQEIEPLITALEAYFKQRSATKH